MNRTLMNIAAVERETGLGKDTLRVWERRYGFPQPERDQHGERAYPLEQVEKLRLVKRLMGQGLRPGRLLAASDADLAQLGAPVTAPEVGTAEGGICATLLPLIRQHDLPAVSNALRQTLHRQGLQHFVLETVSALNRAVGEAWMRGEIEVFEEHLYTEQMQALLRQAIGGLPPGDRPRILLTTVPEEQHVLGLLMIEALLTLDGANCVSLGTQTPLADIRLAAQAQRADIVALSFSAAFPVRQVLPLLSQLRPMLDPRTELWAGGAALERLAQPPGVQLMRHLRDALAGLTSWREAKAHRGS
ncbi:MAG: MerR family transcriptional regulator [Burkholderiales bacterium]|nr:MAG: MerR family transcriptional regulator [Burkholderiales bacterium]